MIYLQLDRHKHWHWEEEANRKNSWKLIRDPYVMNMAEHLDPNVKFKKVRMRYENNNGNRTNLTQVLVYMKSRHDRLLFSLFCGGLEVHDIDDETMREISEYKTKRDHFKR